jgi:hypothetical protein
VKRICILGIFFLFFQVLPVYAQSNYQDDINKLNAEKIRINSEINNVEKLKNNYINIIGLIEKGYTIDRFFTPKDVIENFGKNPDRYSVIQKLYLFVQEANCKISSLQNDIIKLDQAIKSYENETWLSRDREADRISRQRWQEETARQQKIEEESSRNYKIRENIETTVEGINRLYFWLRPGKANDTYPFPYIYTYPYVPYYPYYPYIFRSK